MAWFSTVMVSLRLKATVYPIIDATRNHIAIVARPRGNDWLCDEINAFSREGIEILVSMLTDEEAEELGLNDESAECAAAEISFVNVPIPDRSVPSDTNAFLCCVEQLVARADTEALLKRDLEAAQRFVRLVQC